MTTKQVIFLLLCWLGLCGLAAAAQKVGGPCGYKTYPGQAEILEVTLQPETGKYKIMFDFRPDDTVKEELVDLNKPHRFVLGFSGDPDGDYVKRCGLRPGLALRCELNVIKSGTCTPVIYRFPELPEK